MIKKFIPLLLAINLYSSPITFKGILYEIKRENNEIIIYCENDKALEYIKNNQNYINKIKEIGIVAEFADSFCNKYKDIELNFRSIFFKEQLKQVFSAEADIISIQNFLIDCIKDISNCFESLFDIEFKKNLGRNIKEEMINERTILLYNEILPLYFSANKLYEDIKSTTINETNYQIIKNKILSILPILEPALNLAKKYPSKPREDLIELIEQKKYDEYKKALWEGINSNYLWKEFIDEINKNSKEIKTKFDNFLNKEYNINFEIMKKEIKKEIKNLPW
ncbi:MAG: hypothetical protein QXO12_00615 [Candidatus Pacearchaeota archaeon]